MRETYKGFVRNGAMLNKVDKKKLRKIDNELATLSLKFGDNVLKDSNSTYLELQLPDIKISLLF